VWLPVTWIAFAALMGAARPVEARIEITSPAATVPPDWTHRQTFEADGFLYVVGEGLSADGYPLAARIAKADAAGKVAEAVSLSVKTDMTRRVGVRGGGASEHLVTDTVQMASEFVTLANLRHQEDVRDVVTGPAGSTYRVASLYRIPLGEVHAAQRQALRALRARAARLRDARSEADALKLLEGLEAK
jgi:hypothetical protein